MQELKQIIHLILIGECWPKLQVSCGADCTAVVSNMMLVLMEESKLATLAINLFHVSNWFTSLRFDRA